MTCEICGAQPPTDTCPQRRRYDVEGDREREGDRLQEERQEFRERNAETIQVWRNY